MNNPHPTPAAPAAGLRLKIASDLLSTNAGRIRESTLAALESAASSRPPIVEIDLRGARIVDSVGLNLLVAIIKRARTWEGKTRLLVDDPNVIRTLQFTRLDTQAEVVRP